MYKISGVSDDLTLSDLRAHAVVWLHLGPHPSSLISSSIGTPWRWGYFIFFSTYPDLVWRLTPGRHAKFMLEETDERMSKHNAGYVFSRLRGDVVTQMSTLVLGSHPTLLWPWGRNTVLTWAPTESLQAWTVSPYPWISSSTLLPAVVHGQLLFVQWLDEGINIFYRWITMRNQLVLRCIWYCIHNDPIK